MKRRTKIVCTLGPATSDLESLEKLVEAGMDVARLNFSHGVPEEHQKRVENTRKAAERAGRSVAIMQDLQGPKIRLGQVKDGGVIIHPGDRLVLTTNYVEEGDENRVYVDRDSLAEDVEAGGRILVDDGMLELEILEAGDNDVVTEVLIGGMMKSRKGVNLPHIRTTTPALTEKDYKDLEYGLSLDIDLIALSFVRSANDVKQLNNKLEELGHDIDVIAKIEKPEAVRAIDDIIEEANGVMVARGDLGIEMPMAQVPSTQKMIIRKCQAAAKPVITATQMLESMEKNPRPTRAEASDVANAVHDGSDALMLSGETAVGQYPSRVVEVMAEIVRQAEAYREKFREHLDHPPGVLERSEDVTKSVSFTACRLAEQVGATAIACLTNSGTTARNIARHRPSMPIYAFTNQEHVGGRLCVLWGTSSFLIPFQRDTDRGVELVHNILKESGVVSRGDRIVLTAGMPLPAKGRTNTVHVSRIS